MAFSFRRLLLAASALLMVQGTAQAGQFDGVTVAGLVSSSPPLINCLKLVATEFEATTGAKLRFNALGYVALHDAALAALASGTTAYDVINLAYQWTGEFADPGFLMPLDASLTPADTAGMIPRTLELYGKYQGKQVMLPFNGEAMLLFYRRDLFEAAGLTPPKTWDDWNKAAAIFAKEGLFGASVMGDRAQGLTMWSNRYWGLGGGSLDPDGAGKLTLDQPIAIKALEQLKADVFTNSPKGALSFSAVDASAQFLNGKAAMVEMWPSYLGPITLDPARAGVTLGKAAAAMEPGGHPHSGGLGLSVISTSKNKEAALAFIKLATSQKYDKECFAKTGKGPVYAETYATDGPQYWLKPLAEAIAAANPRSRGRDASKVNDMFDQVVSRYLAGELTAPAAAAEMQKRADEAATQ
jgi:multiple sugar transport system substrate-binding protein